MAVQDQDLTGKSIVVTGASSGIGAAAAATFAARGATVAVVGRSPERTAEVAAKAGAEPFLADFARFDEVRRLAEQLLDRYSHIDVLANNAGGSWPKRTPTDDGNELTFQVNHLSPFLLTTLLLDRLVRSRARVINTASVTYRMARLNLDTVNATTGSFNQMGAYAASKLANILFTRELARRTAGTGLVTAAFHPGAVATHVYDRAPLGLGWLIRSPLSKPFFIRPEKGSEPLVHLATTADDINGQYFHQFKLEPPSNKQAVDAALAQQLWEMSERVTG
ncbi:NAD(P)-dependent dehydrogenase (short-subunit alcohol dehydrogenase family) [Nocardia tenerifensis]|uniref:NAD(P)-dependent dehydrogenase (Short-subunit alcohol dehydrogenase family) n=1 Tax=Nocardia tenerifensis TaxID=228006 RepID=A0A318K2T7_9NOCA|nr:SDR family NAD(P)-dependent oxidoreductase [Nocardia tenerifensis]PXX65601.1 NAD(P)-dependent dehydrogenase (short-subunit alcohol dehydrogenase family) [Nocardia tenerifensis]